MAILKPDKIFNYNGVTVNQYLLTEHNPNKIDMPTKNRTKTVGVTIHNTEAISTASNTTPAEQYTRATMNGNMGTVRVHFYVDDTCAWQMLPIDLINWSCADGTSNPNSGNNTTISMEVIGNSKKAEENAQKLAAYLLKERNLNVDQNLFSHTYWLNVRDGVKGTIAELCVKKHPYKWCPVYILPHWTEFREGIRSIMGTSKTKTETVPPTTTQSQPKPEPTKLYRIRKAWDDAKSQIGAFSSLDNAIKSWKEGYFVFDNDGTIVYPKDGGTKVETKVETLPAIDVVYKVYANGKWLPEVKNLNDYAGIDEYSIRYLMAKASKGQLSYRVHLYQNGWLGWIKGYNEKDGVNGFAGFGKFAIDGLEMKFDLEGYDVKYRVSKVGSKEYYPWVMGSENEYAGLIGNKIDKVQICIIKK